MYSIAAYSTFTLTNEHSNNLLKSDKLYKAIVMYEQSNRSFKHHQSNALPLLSPPPYEPPSHTASALPQQPPLNDDYRCTISHQPPNTTMINISIHLHQHLSPGRIPCWRVRRRLIALDQPICAHRRTSDPAFFRAVRRRMNTLCVSFGSREYLPFFGRWTDRSRVWACAEQGCNMEAWVTRDRDTGWLRLWARTKWTGELEGEDRKLLEVVKGRAERGGGLRFE
ncbi:hypothetical protein SVAN01_01078 [Stagonosporopsis vannaccii]|nr:hypothetical protein SVAN01_01078 [Stagonosporopsis vannaccii]